MTKQYWKQHPILGLMRVDGCTIRSDLSDSNLSGAEGWLDQASYLAENFESDGHGVIVYKSFGSNYASPDAWEIKPGSHITEVVNPDRATDCACGVNVAHSVGASGTVPAKSGAVESNGWIWRALLCHCIPMARFAARGFCCLGRLTDA